MKKALLIAIDTYEQSMHNLDGCNNDVDSIYNLLVNEFDFSPQSITILRNEQATLDEIINQLFMLISQVYQGDKLFFYFSGHGMQLPERVKGTEKDGMDEILCPHDFDFSTYKKALRDDDLHEVFAKIPLGASLFWISDSCHSGDLSESNPPWYFWYPFQEKIANQVVLITGCQSKEKSYFFDYQHKKHGVLTHSVLTLLTDDTENRHLPLSELIKKIRWKVQKYKEHQTPQLEGHTLLMGKSVDDLLM